MSLNIFKYIGLGILGLGGASSVAALSSSRVRKFMGLSFSDKEPFISVLDVDLVLNEEDRKGQFLYELSKKVFNSLKFNSQTSNYDNLIHWLKDKFNGSLESEEDTWENFKSLCEEQKSKETKLAPNMINEHSRLCFLDGNAQKNRQNVKGGLFNWGEKLKYHQFYPLGKSNFELWIEFQTSHPNSNPSNVFDDGYSSNEQPAVRNFKEVIDNVSFVLKSVEL